MKKADPKDLNKSHGEETDWEKLSQDFKNLEEELEEAKTKYLRALADYQNLERQTQVWREDFAKFAGQNLILQVLEVLDDLEKTLDHIKDEGLGLVVEKLKKVLKGNGLEELGVLGLEFDPVCCEAISVEPGEEDHKVVKILQKGYKLNGKIIRPAKVVVSSKE